MMNPYLFQLVVVLMTLLVPGKDHTVLATAITEVVQDNPALFPDDPLDANKRLTISLIIAIGFREGSLKESVVGDCTLPGKLGLVPCDTPGSVPHSFCSMQVHDSVGGSDWLNENPRLCIEAGTRILRSSVRSCPKFPVAIYASGPDACDNKRAKNISNDRMSLARWLATRPIELTPDFPIIHMGLFPMGTSPAPKPPAMP